MKYTFVIIILSIGNILGNNSFVLDSIKTLFKINQKKSEKRFLNKNNPLSTNSCNINYLSDKKDVSYDDVVKHIKSVVSSCPEFKSASYNRVAYLVDTFGPRLWGSEPLRDATNFMKEELLKEVFIFNGISFASTLFNLFILLYMLILF